MFSTRCAAAVRLAVLVTALLLFPLAARAQVTAFVDLGLSGDGLGPGNRVSVNNNRDVVGSRPTGVGTDFVATRWSESNNFQPQSLGTLGGGVLSSATSVNDSGLVVGAATNSLGEQRAVNYASGVTALSSAFSRANGVNSGGVIVGAEANVGGDLRAVRFQSGAGVDLGTLNGGAGQSEAFAVNDADDVVGVSDTTTPGGARAFLFRNNVMTDLLGSATVSNNMSLAVGDSIAFGINGNMVVGRFTDTVTGDERGFLYTINATSLLDLGTLGGGFTEARGVNSSGFVVGTAINGLGGQRAFLYNGTTIQDLNTVVGNLGLSTNGLTLTQAFSISNEGGIAGIGMDSLGRDHAFYFGPTNLPEPTTASLLLIGGLSSAALVVRRRQRGRL